LTSPVYLSHPVRLKATSLPAPQSITKFNPQRINMIFDCRLLIDRAGSCHTASSIDNRQSAIGNENLVFGCGYAPLSACPFLMP